mgnify:CR=1 FL=1
MCIRDSSLGSDRGRKYGSESSVHLLKADDNITLSFQTTEPVDPPQVRLKIGENPVEMSRFEVYADNQSGTVDSTKWYASYQVGPGDNGTLEWSIEGIDRVGNALVLGESDNISGLSFTDHNQISYEVDNTRPLVSTLVFTEDNAELDRGEKYGKQYDNETSVSLLKSGDNVSLSFKTSEGVDSPSLSLRIGSRNISISDIEFREDPAGDTSGQSWKAHYRIRDNDSGELEWTISGIDRAGNPLRLGELDNVSGLVFSDYNCIAYHADTTDPVVHTVVFTEDLSLIHI